MGKSVIILDIIKEWWEKSVFQFSIVNSKKPVEIDPSKLI